MRRLALDIAPPIYGEHMVWRGLAPFSPREPDAVQFWLGEGCFFGLAPVGDGVTYGFANVTTPRLRDPAGGRLTRLRTLFAAFGSEIQDFLASLEGDVEIHCAPIESLEAADRRRRALPRSSREIANGGLLPLLSARRRRVLVRAERASHLVAARCRRRPEPRLPHVQRFPR